MATGVMALGQLQNKILCTFPKRLTAECVEIIETRCECDEMVAGKLTGFGREVNATIGEKDLGLANTSGIDDDLTRGRVARVVFKADAEIKTIQWDP